jgi:hypothetical protein
MLSITIFYRTITQQSLLRGGKGIKRALDKRNDYNIGKTASPKKQNKSNVVMKTTPTRSRTAITQSIVIPFASTNNPNLRKEAHFYRWLACENRHSS